MIHTHILLSRHERVLTITLNRPAVLNSVNALMAAELRDVLDEAGRDPDVRSVLITGAGRGFCAGQDLAEVLPKENEVMPDLGEVVHRQYTPVVRAIRTIEKPVVCAVNGVAAGAGANIAFACDITIAAEGVHFIQSFGKVGLIPDSGGTFILPRIVGLQRAAALTMLGDKLSAAQALEWGLLYSVVPPQTLADAAMALAIRLARMPTRALGLTKRGFNAAFANDLETQLALEEELQREAGRSGDYAEGVNAFVQKRAPSFTGR